MQWSIAGPPLHSFCPISTASSHESVRKDQRTCQFGYWKTLEGSTPPRTEHADEQYCTGLAYWFQPSPLPRDPASAARWFGSRGQTRACGCDGRLGVSV